MKIIYISFAIVCCVVGTGRNSFAETIEAKDTAAEMYFYRCAGCHTIGGGNLSGPDLSAASQWADEDLRSATKRMEKNVGTMTDDEISQLVSFIKDMAAPDRLTRLKQKIESKTRLELPAPSFNKGRELFVGEKPLINGGVACIACHQFGQLGGNLGPDLTAIKDKASGIVLQSGIENANYKVMKPIYAKHKITKEESMHLAEYLSHPEQVKTAFIVSSSKVMNLAWMGVALFFILLWNLNRLRKGNTRDKLFNKSSRG